MRQPELFKSAKGEPAFETSVCIFMDVLGFVEAQKRSFREGRGQTDFQRFYSSVKRELQTLNESEYDPSNPSWRLKIFTDNIVLGYPLRNDHHESVIGNVAMDISRYQLGMARDGYFVRGGMALDSLFIDEYLAYGPALLEAYELEHDVARDPRIVVSKTVRKFLEEHFSYYAQPQDAPQNHVFLLDSDGQIFLNYLEPCFEPLREGDAPDTETLLLHKSHIERGLKDFAANPRVWAKYAWLSSYHNSVVSEWNGEAGLGEEFLVDKKLHRTGPVRISPFLIPAKKIP
jgi:hypothetical protein